MGVFAMLSKLGAGKFKYMKRHNIGHLGEW